VPLAAVVAFGIDGFCRVELNPFGPVQLNVAPAVEVDPVKLNVCPAQIGPLFFAVTLAGGEVMVTTIESLVVAHEPKLAVKVNVTVPAAMSAALGV
jgi:hypothetical protein